MKHLPIILFFLTVNLITSLQAQTGNQIDLEFEKICLVDSLLTGEQQQFWRFYAINSEQSFDRTYDLSSSYNVQGLTQPCCCNSDGNNSSDTDVSEFAINDTSDSLCIVEDDVRFCVALGAIGGLDTDVKAFYHEADSLVLIEDEKVYRVKRDIEDSCKDTIFNAGYQIGNHLSYTGGVIVDGDLENNLPDAVVIGFTGPDAIIAVCGIHKLADPTTLAFGEYFAGLTPGDPVQPPPPDTTNVPLFEIINSQEIIVNLMRPLEKVKEAEEPQLRTTEVTGDTSNLEVGSPLAFVNGSWVQANTANIESVHTSFVFEIIDGNTFSIIHDGIIEKVGHELTVGASYYLDELGNIQTQPAYNISDWVYFIPDANHIQLIQGHAFARNIYVQDQTTQNNIQLFVKDAQILTLKVRTADNSGYQIIWGDGTITSALSNSDHSHTFGTNYTGYVELKGLDGTQVRDIEIDGSWAFDVLKLFVYSPFLERIVSNQETKCYGDFGKVPSSIKYIDTSSGTFHGRIKNLKEGFERLRMIEGKIIIENSDFPASTIYVGLTGGGNGTFVKGLIHIGFPDNCGHYDVQGRSNIGGDIGLIGKPIPKIFNVSGQNTIDSYTSGNLTYTENPEIFILAGQASLTTTEVDNLLIDLSAFTWSGAKNLILKVGSQRSAASDAAVTSLQNQGVNVTIL